LDGPGFLYHAGETLPTAGFVDVAFLKMEGAKAPGSTSESHPANAELFTHTFIVLELDINYPRTINCLPQTFDTSGYVVCITAEPNPLFPRAE